MRKSKRLVTTQETHTKIELQETRRKIQKLKNELLIQEVQKENKKAKANPSEIPHSESCKGTASSPKSTDVSEKLSEVSLDGFGIPSRIVGKYARFGIKKLWNWQVKCLNEKHVVKDSTALDGNSIVYSAPTTAGKTLVAEILLLRQLFLHQKMVLFIVPYRSLVMEKIAYMKRTYESCFKRYGMKILSYLGNDESDISSLYNGAHLVVGTIEKICTIVNTLIYSNKISSVGAVVIDEIHIIGDAHRGPRLENLLSKLRAMEKYDFKGRRDNSCKVQKKGDNRACGPRFQIIGLSATIQNGPRLASWLDAIYYSGDSMTTRRPIPLEEFVVCKSGIFRKNGTKTSDLNLPEGMRVKDKENQVLLSLCMETLLNSQSALIFCATKAQTNYGASLLLKALKKKTVALEQNDSELAHVNGFHLKVGVHHSGLSIADKNSVEQKFRKGEMKILFCTSTLSAGVNLPANRVIIRSRFLGKEKLSAIQYHQMIGRAGRTGMALKGESFMFALDWRKEAAISFISDECRAIRGQLFSKLENFEVFILDCIGTGMVQNDEELKSCITSTLSFQLSAADNNSECHRKNKMDILEKAENIVKKLNDKRFIVTVPVFQPTQLGVASIFSGFTPTVALELIKTLPNSSNCGSSLHSDLQLLIHMAPMFSTIGVNWACFEKRYRNLHKNDKLLLEQNHIQEGYIFTCANAVVPTKHHVCYEKGYKALILLDLINERTLEQVSRYYKIDIGRLQELQREATAHANCLQVFCHHLRWQNTCTMLKGFAERLQWGVKTELLALLRIPGLPVDLARHLHKCKVTTPEVLASKKTAHVEKILLSFASGYLNVLENLFETLLEVEDEEEDQEDQFDLSNDYIRDYTEELGQEKARVEGSADPLAEVACKVAVVLIRRADAKLINEIESNNIPF